MGVRVGGLQAIQNLIRKRGFWGTPESRTFGELLIDLEENKAARAVVFGLLREMGRQ